MQWFSAKMESVLASWDDERGEEWKEKGILELFNHLKQEVDELGEELAKCVESSSIHREQVIKECADVGNIAMMIADNSREK